MQKGLLILQIKIKNIGGIIIPDLILTELIIIQSRFEFGFKR